jgi:hypothetical protein
MFMIRSEYVQIKRNFHILDIYRYPANTGAECKTLLSALDRALRAAR